MNNIKDNTLVKTSITFSKTQKVLAFLFLAIFAFFFVNYDIDSDLWFILNHGKYIFEHGFPTTNPFSCINGLDFIIPQWLSATIYYAVYTVLGKYGVITLAALVGIAQIFIIYKICLLISENAVSSYIISIITYLPLSLFIVTRPQIFSFTIFLLEIYFLEKYCKTNNLKTLIALPILSLLLVNFHAATYPMFIVFTLPFLCGKITLKIKNIDKENYSLLPLIVSVLISIPVALINPYTYKALIYGLQSYRIGNVSAFVVEMLPINIENSHGALFFVFLFIVFALFALTKARNINLKTRYVLLYFGTVILALLTLRNLVFFYMSVAVVSAHLFGNIFDIKILFKKKNKILLKCVAIFICILCVAKVFVFIPFDLDKMYESTPSKNAIDYLAENYNIKDKNVYASINDGFYLEWKGAKVVYDMRVEQMFKQLNGKEDLLTEYLKVDTNEEISKTIKKYNFEFFVVSKGSVYYKYLLDNDNYNKVIKKDGYIVFAQSNIKAK